MRREGRTTRTLPAVVSVLLAGGLAACDPGPEIVTSIVFDGSTRSFTTKNVMCTRQSIDDGLVILVHDTGKRMIRIQLTQHGRLVVQKVGLRYEDMAGYVEDSREVSATKVDDTFAVSGRMPPNPGESARHTFKVQTTCPGYVDAVPSTGHPENGAP